MPVLRTTFYLGGNAPYDLSERATESLFSNGEDLDAYIEYLIFAEARYHLSGQRYTGLCAELGADRDEAQTVGSTNSVENAFIGISPGYTAHVFGDFVPLPPNQKPWIIAGGS